MLEPTILVLTCLLACATFAAIFRQAGYPRAYAILMLIPAVNAIGLLVFSLREWPATRELAFRRLADGDASSADELSVLGQACELQNRREDAQARKLFELILARAQGAAVKEDAASCLERLNRQVPAVE